MKNETKTEQQKQYVEELLAKRKTNRIQMLSGENKNVVRLRKFLCSIPDTIVSKLKLKNHQRIIVYKDDNMNFFISKGDNMGFRIRNDCYINANRIIKTGMKVGDYEYIDKCIERGGVLLYVFILSGKPIFKDTIKQIGWDYRGGSNSAAVLYPDKKILSVPVSTPKGFFSKSASDYLGLKKGKRGFIIQGADKERYLMVIDKNASNITNGLLISKYKEVGRFAITSSKIQKKTLPPAVYEIEKAGDMAGIPYYKLIKIGEALHSNH